MTGAIVTGRLLRRGAARRARAVAGSLLWAWLLAGPWGGVCPAGVMTPAPAPKALQSQAPACGPASGEDLRPLEPGMAVERELGGGQSHTYEVVVSAGQFVRVVVDQRGIDIVARVCAADGRELAQVDRPNGANGPEAVSILSDQAGVVLLNVRSLEKGAPLGRYRVSIAERRSPRPGDETRVEAERATSEGEALRARGKLESLRAAADKFALAGSLWRSLQEPYEEALALYGEGWSRSEIGSYGMVKFPIPVHRLRWSYEARGEHEKAVECFSRSLALMKGQGDSHGEAIVRAGLGWPMLYLGRNREALESFGEAYRLFEAAGNTRGEAIALYGSGWVNAIEGDDQRALEDFLQSLTLRRASKDRKGDAITLAGISRVQGRLGRNQEAIEYAERALALFDDLGDAHGRASVYSTLGWINYSLGRSQQALDAFQRAREIRGKAGDLTGEANSLYGMARVLDRDGKREEALGLMQQVLGIVEPLREKGDNSNLRTYYFANVQEYYEFYVDLLMRLASTGLGEHYAEAAVAAHERALARELLAILAEAGEVSARAGADLARPLEAAEIRSLLDADTVLLEYALGEERSYVWAVSGTRVRGYELPGRAYIEARAVKLYNLLTARNRREPGESEEARRARVASADRQYPDEAAALGRLLLGPVSAELKAKRVVVVAEGALQLIPFGVLPSPSTPRTAPRPLALDFEVVSLPSASVLSAVRREVAGRDPAPLSLAVMADPVFTADDPRVRPTSAAREKGAPPGPGGSSQPSPTRDVRDRAGAFEGASPGEMRRLLGTRWEGQQIAALVPEGEGLLALDFGASRSRALSGDLGLYRIVHFATHALVEDDDPAASAVMLSRVDEHGRPREGSLTLGDIYGLNLRADLVVLSACRTGLGRDVRGEGMRGLAGGFMHAGVPRVVVSLWPVSDNVTAEFMVRFYRLMLGARRMPAAAALREAQAQMLKDARWRPAYFWAPFILQGEWR